MPFYMKIDGIAGSVTVKDYKDWIELSAIDLGVGCTMKTTVGQVNNRRCYLPHFTNLNVSKFVDKSSPLLFQSACKGAVLIHACRGADEPQPYLEYELKNTIICNYHSTGAGDSETDNPVSESLGLNFTKISLKFIERTQDNSSAAPVASGYDLEAAKTD